MKQQFRLLLVLVVVLVSFPVTSLAQRTNVARQFPMYDNGGKPDLTMDPQRFESQMEIVDRYFSETDCAYQEGVVGGTGYRRLLRFDTMVLNRGGGDLIVGDRTDPDNEYAEWFYFHPCHGHYHLRDFSVYELLDENDNPVASGTKQGFCFEDSHKYDGGKSNGYDCEYQGLTSGWGDFYYKQLVGQWIDITGVPEGDYTVRVTLNKGDETGPIFDEGENRYSNVSELRIHVPDPRKKVTFEP